MNIDQQKRFTEVFDRKLSPDQLEGISLLTDRALRASLEAPESQVAYILATAYWESALTFQPVREGLAKSDQEARVFVKKLFEDGRIKTNYAIPAENGQSFYGRGYVQLTWEKNYRAMGDHLIGDPHIFYHNPDMVMQPRLSAIIMVRGMIDGIFTDHKLGDFINRDRIDFVNARQTVNRMDRAEKIAEWAEHFRYIGNGRRFV